MRVRRHHNDGGNGEEIRLRIGHHPSFFSFSPPLSLIHPLSNTQAWTPTSTLSCYRSISYNTQTPHHRLTPDPKTTLLRHGIHNTTGCTCCCRSITSSENCYGGVYLQTRPVHVAVCCPYRSHETFRQNIVDFIDIDTTASW